MICSLKRKDRNRVIQMLIDSTKRDKPLPVISIIETMKIPVLTWNDILAISLQVSNGIFIVSIIEITGRGLSQPIKPPP